jgi:hypothetical protein
VPLEERALAALVVETRLLAVEALLPAPPGELPKPGDKARRNCVANRSSVLVGLLGMALPVAAVAAGVSAGTDNKDDDDGGTDAVAGEAV